MTQTNLIAQATASADRAIDGLKKAYDLRILELETRIAELEEENRDLRKIAVIQSEHVAELTKQFQDR